MTLIEKALWGVLISSALAAALVVVLVGGWLLLALGGV